MKRKEFIESYGATCKNWTWSWSFVNPKERFVIFGAWDKNVTGGSELILSGDWQKSKGRILPAYTQAREHIRLVEEEGYQLKTFPMQFSDELQDEDGNGPAKIKGFAPVLSERQLRKVGEDWFAELKPNEEKIARICWNTEGWKKPSGTAGKSKNKDAYEFQNGYGHEEWLLDTTKLIDGYHYAYIQAIGTHREKYIGKTFDISFYSINSETKQHWWVGSIKNVHIIGEAESIKIFAAYQRNGWHDEMIRQLEHVNADVKAFKSFTTPNSFAVLKFRVEDLELLDEPLEFSHDDPAVSSDYYNLKNKTQLPKLSNSGNFNFVTGHNEKKGKSVSTYRGHSSDVDLVHNRIQTGLFNYLTKNYGKDNVGTEIPTGRGTLIDAVVKHDNEYTFYEIKTSPSVRQCIREAIGQLLEYAHFGNKVALKELVVVSPYKINLDGEQYLSTIREKYGVPISYCQFDMEAMKLMDSLSVP
jgi:hypothetical protein